MKPLKHSIHIHQANIYKQQQAHCALRAVWAVSGKGHSLWVSFWRAAGNTTKSMKQTFSLRITPEYNYFFADNTKELSKPFIYRSNKETNGNW